VGQRRESAVPTIFLRIRKAVGTLRFAHPTNYEPDFFLAFATSSGVTSGAALPKELRM
jgi:hypothetical protein